MKYVYVIWDFCILTLFLMLTGTEAMADDITGKVEALIVTLSFSTLQAVIMTLRFIK